MRISWPEFAFFKVSSASNPNRPTETVSNSKLEPPAKQSVRLWRLDSLYYLFLAVKKFPPPSTFTLTPCKSAIYISLRISFNFSLANLLFGEAYSTRRGQGPFIFFESKVFISEYLYPRIPSSRESAVCPRFNNISSQRVAQ